MQARHEIEESERSSADEDLKRLSSAAPESVLSDADISGLLSLRWLRSLTSAPQLTQRASSGEFNHFNKYDHHLRDPELE